MSAYKKQHIIPKTYLKQFAMADSHVALVQFDNPYNKRIQRKGIGDKVFCQSNYYDFPNRNHEPVLEKLFSINEQSYQEFLAMLVDETELGYPLKQSLINWMLMMKSRSNFYRDQVADVVGWIEKTTYGLANGREAMEEKNDAFRIKGKLVSKGLQLSRFLQTDMYAELQKEYSLNFLNRKWVMVKAGKREFLTSDNPGYSFTFSQDLERLGMSPVSGVYNLNNNVNSAHVFPLTKQFCLQLLPVL